LKILGSITLFILSFIILGLFLIQYWKYLKYKKSKIKEILISLRLFSFSIILFLLINPIFYINQTVLIKPEIAVILDKSESIYHHFNEINFNYNKIDKIFNNWSKDKNLLVNNYVLDKRIKKLKDNSKIMEYTDFSDLKNFVEFNKYDHYILITDGNSTQGIPLGYFSSFNSSPIHTIGIGPIKSQDDLYIEKVEYDKIESINNYANIKVYLKVQISKPIITYLNITNELGENIYQEKIEINAASSGTKVFDIQLALNSITDNNFVEITPIINEVNKDNNMYTLHIDRKINKDKVLLISGSVSSNTPLIKSIILDNNNFLVDHQFRINNNDWNQSENYYAECDPNIIILDDFPINANDQFFLKKVIDFSKTKNISILYFEGPQSNLSSAELIRKNIGTIDFELVGIEEEIKIDIKKNSKTRIKKFPPIKRNILWKNEKNILEFIDNKAIITDNEGFNIIAIPNLSSIFFKLKQTNESKLFKNLINSVILKNYYKGNQLFTINVDKNRISIFEKIKIDIMFYNKNIYVDNVEIYSIDQYLDTLKFKTNNNQNNKWGSELEFSEPGNYKIYSLINLNDGSELKSNYINIKVNDLKIEYKDLIQEQNILMAISQKTNGTYSNINALETVLNRIDLKQKYKEVKINYNVFSFQDYWWIIIILLSIEWYLRKKFGLL
tara:strand:+ start:1563 stop:3578 length:2016 start_codon:yes stop_codon:yes gene_type:complete